MQPDTTNHNPPGLSDQQQRAAVLLVSGVTVQDVAEQLAVHRTTLWHWRNLETFQAYLNQLRTEAQDQAVEGITALQEKALATVERLMDGGNDGVALRAASLVLEVAQARRLGATDPRQLIRDRQAKATMDMLANVFGDDGDGKAFNRRCRELGLDP